MVKRFLKQNWIVFAIVAVDIALIVFINWLLPSIAIQLDRILGIVGIIMTWIIAVRDTTILEIALTTLKKPKELYATPGGLGIDPIYQIVIKNVGSKIPAYIKSYRFSSSGGLITLGDTTGTPIPNDGFIVDIPPNPDRSESDFIHIEIADNNGKRQSRDYRLPFVKSNLSWGQPIRIK